MSRWVLPPLSEPMYDALLHELHGHAREWGHDPNCQLCGARAKLRTALPEEEAVDRMQEAIGNTFPMEAIYGSDDREEMARAALSSLDMSAERKAEGA